MSKPNFIITDTQVTLHFGKGIVKTISTIDPKFNDVTSMLTPLHPATKEDILKFIDPVEQIKKHPSGLFDVLNGVVYVNKKALPEFLSKRLLQLVNAKLPVDRILKFWDKLESNPDKSVVNDLYEFLEHNGHPLTEDGCFIAYKAVDPQYMDLRTHTVSNKVGDKPSMPRELVDDNRQQTCSSGLHVANLEYARDHYGTWCGSNILIVVKVNPYDVVSVPVDYRNMKMRTCGYEVIEVLEDRTTPIQTPTYDPGKDNIKQCQHPVVTNTVTNITVNELKGKLKTKVSNSSKDNYLHQIRDSKGRFIKMK